MEALRWENSLPADLFLYAWNEVLSCSHLPSHVGLPVSIMVSFYRFPMTWIPSKQRNRKGKLFVDYLYFTVATDKK